MSGNGRDDWLPSLRRDNPYLSWGDVPHSVAPFVPTPINVVRRMLKLAEVGPDDVVYDLGCGDGRILFMAVEDFEAERAVGYNINSSMAEPLQKKIENRGPRGQDRGRERQLLRDGYLPGVGRDDVPHHLGQLEAEAQAGGGARGWGEGGEPRLPGPQLDHRKGVGAPPTTRWDPTRSICTASPRPLRTSSGSNGVRMRKDGGRG